MKRVDRLALEEMSVKAYGTKTRYKKMLDRGVLEDKKDEKGKPLRFYQRIELDEIQAIMEEEIEEKAKKEAELAEKKRLAEEESARAKEQPASEPTNT